MEGVGYFVMTIGIIFTLLALLSPIRKIIFSVLSVIIWLPVSVLVAAEETAVKGFWILFFGLAMLMFMWTAVLIMERLTGRLLIDKEKKV